MIPVRPGPDQYLCQGGILIQLEELLQKQGWKRALLIHGDSSWRAARPYLPIRALERCDLLPSIDLCTDREVKRLSNFVDPATQDVIIGVGGGRVMDLAKAVANRRGLPILLIPTLPSTCAACTPLSVFYDDKGAFIRYDIHPQGQRLVLVEPDILLHAPVTSLRAGIGDTLAKWYEAKALSATLVEQPVSIRMGLQAASICRNILLTDGEGALSAIKTNTITPSFLRVIDCILMLGGTVGGFAERYGRVAAAHSVHNALTHVSAAKGWLHGDKVAYGILIQLALTDNWEEIDLLIPYYKALGLPASLSELGVDPGNKELLRLLARTALQKNESIHNMEQDFTEEDLLNALQRVEYHTTFQKEELPL
ncbi:iron-containing alcohol dehydrogenase family protein [Kroppenstedtia pulmonis]|uniref:Iron-containing alcohol dehydrogenase family protein n=1 Tax=Kroppenstedtia pulmonis TaxID=1380685 RepID=A0A7D3XLX3_9BACL|nr:iron-containing alcohol dehydrogenase family protein [Kroppenstedtia pulmonis]QKG83969.1 iron-containing alcohol dehydrogenase family protein [Kroppenstedtia pulmonis]